MRKPRVVLLPVLGLFAALALSGFLWLHFAGAASPAIPEQMLVCGACHSMQQAVQTWQQSAHDDLSCLQCHSEGNGPKIKDEFLKLTADETMQPGKAAPCPVDAKVSNDRCLECHQPQMDQVMRDITPAPLKAATVSPNQGKPMLTKAAHELHMNGDAKLNCVDCHTDSAHGPAVGTTERQNETHNVCMECHVQKQVAIAVTGDVSCAACHTDPKSVEPADHKNAEQWLTAHGKATQTQACGQCHLSDSAGPHARLSEPASFPTASEDACQSCHAGTTMPHPAGYMAIHGNEALKASASCETCHSPANPANSGASYAAATFCTDCHAGTTMPHPPGYLKLHGQAAQAKPATCGACHSPQNPAKPNAEHASVTYCMACHDTYQHPAGWVADHGAKSDDPSCATCHTLQGQPGQHNACSTCHSSPIGTGTETWHPAMFFITHAKEVEANGKESCLTCHNDVKPSCSQCHTKF